MFQAKAQERDRTADLVLTKDVLYRLSYLGTSSRRSVADVFAKLDNKEISQRSALPNSRTGAGNGIRTRDPELGRLAL